jgi:hypothetical protein
MSPTSAPRCRRPRSASRRSNRVAIKYNDAEMAAVECAAARAGLAVAAYLARAGIDAATGTAIPASRAQLDALKALQDATETARRAGRLFNQSVARLHSTGAAGPELRRYAGNAARTVKALENASIAAARKIL